MFGDGIQAAIPRLQAYAESMMLDSCAIESVTQEPDPDSLEMVDTATEVHYDGKCRFKPSEGAGRQADAGEDEFVQANLVLQLPIGSPIPPVGARVTWTAVDPVAGDPAQVGRIFWTGRTDARSQATKRQVTLTEVRPS